MRLKVLEKTGAAVDTVRIRLGEAGGASLPAFKPGAHIEITVRGLVRCYSLTSSPAALDHYEICVLRTMPGRGGSAFINDMLAVGDTFEVSGPFNAFSLNEKAEHSVFIAGGIGITPFFSMMEALHCVGRPFELHYSARSRDRLLPIPRFADKVEFYVDAGGRSGLDVDVLLRTIAPRSDIYVCGPQPLIEAVRGKAIERGWGREAIHFESFGAQRHRDDAPIAVHLAQSGLTIDVRPSTSILDALIENGVWAAYECRRGECGTCVTGVLSGVPDHRDVCLTAGQRRSGLCTCVSWAKGAELTLDL